MKRKRIPGGSGWLRAQAYDPAQWGHHPSAHKAKYECRYCGGEFASLRRYDHHLLNLPEDDFRRPVCIGERDGYSVLDSEVVAFRDRLEGVRAARLDRSHQG